MKVISDLHIHGRYSRATSKALDIANLEKYARIKGLTLLGTGDFTHPLWLSELKANLKEDGTGILKTKTGFEFLLQTEISLMYSQGGRGRKIHLVILAPDFSAVEKINSWLLTRGRLDYDGRPIFGMDAITFTEKIKEIDGRIEIVPAHAWTPWFGIFGSMSGFDSIKECFGDLAGKIHMIETGLSSDPAMNWRLSSLDKYSLISNSDSHSFWPWRIGRECNVSEVKENSYENLIKTFATKKGFVETIEVDPSYGKYHFDGHRACNIVMSPEQAKKNNNICPVCHKPLTIGVLHRVEELADRKEGYIPENSVPFRRIIPLSEVIAASVGSSVASKGVFRDYYKLISRFGSEMNVLLDAEESELSKECGEKTAALIMKNRTGSLEVSPGYDGEYGVLKVNGTEFRPEDEGKKPEKNSEKKSSPQKGLSEFI
jgi:uncharacterized protein (TIGR00375 family)